MKKIVLSLLLVSTAISAHAMDETQQNWTYSLGAFSHVSPDYMGSGDYKGSISPFFNATYQWDQHQNYFFIRSHEGIGVQTRLGQAIVGTSLGYRGGREREENTNLAGMHGVNETGTTNLFFRYGHNEYNGGINLSKGLSGDNNGLVISANVGCNCKLSEKVTGSFSVGTAWADNTYMDDYFGVKTNEVTANRTAYKGKKGILNYGISAGLSYQLQEKQSIAISAGLSKISKAQSSPIVASDIQGRLSLGYIHSF
tara:strand:+ start:4144 stop:4908 length:765 start_codon:yes stop_codon:yes gene_type:complete